MNRFVWSKQFTKKNEHVTVYTEYYFVDIFIISYNQLTYVKSMVEQLQNFVPSKYIHILDNNSTYPPMIEYLKSVDNIIQVHRFDRNHGHNVISMIPSITNSQLYIISDPDLILNKNLPSNFISDLISISKKYNSGKVGFALDNKNNIRTDVTYGGKTPEEWESQFWTTPINDPLYELYWASIDTTFCLINKNFNGIDIRVAGNFTCVHRPWLLNWKDEIPPEELYFYKQNNLSSCWIK